MYFCLAVSEQGCLFWTVAGSAASRQQGGKNEFGVFGATQKEKKKEDWQFIQGSYLTTGLWTGTALAYGGCTAGTNPQSLRSRSPTGVVFMYSYNYKQLFTIYNLPVLVWWELKLQILRLITAHPSAHRLHQGKLLRYFAKTDSPLSVLVAAPSYRKTFLSPWFSDSCHILFKKETLRAPPKKKQGASHAARIRTQRQELLGTVGR